MNQPPPPGAPARPDQQSLADLPQHARERIGEMRAKQFFTSDLSVNEFLLVKEAGFEPLGLVMGCSIYQIRPFIPQLPPNVAGCEIGDMTRALYHARYLAMNRMEEEADALGADGIVGVRLEVKLHAAAPPRQWQPNVPMWQQQRQQQIAGNQQAQTFRFGQDVAEFLAIGTAVKHQGGASFKSKNGKPFQSDLTGQDFWKLVRSGYRPCGFVMGNCVYYVRPEVVRSANAQPNCEIPSYTHALYDARELAIERLQWEAEQLGATGIVGVTVTTKQHSWSRGAWANSGNQAMQTGEIIELFVIGTAVVPMEGAKVEEMPRAQLAYAANDKERVAEEGGEE